MKIKRAALQTKGFLHGQIRFFGGSKTSPRRCRGLAYAWREHRRLKKSEPFMFTIIGSRRRKDGTLAPKSVVGFVTRSDRERGIKELARQGYNHFTLFCDVNAQFALQYGKSEYHQEPGHITVNR